MYFGETDAKACGRCDICLEEKRKQDAEEDFKNAKSYILQKTKDKILELKNKGFEFLVGDMPGGENRIGDDRFIAYLKSINAKFTVFGTGSESRVLYQKKSTKQIKQGVEELFNENTELANAVYEVLGFRSDEQKNNDKDAFELEVIERNIDDHNFNGFIINLKIDGKIVGSIQINTGNNGFNVNGELFAEVRNVSTDPSIRGKGYGKMLYALAFEELNKRGFAGFGNFGELVLDKNVFKIRESLITEKIIYDGEESTIYRGFKENKNPLKKQKITPQQKQQAQQLYSDFLSNFVNNNFDTIIQDLQTKNIVDKKCS